MKQIGKSINPGNAQEFIDSTRSVHQGQMQFLTPFHFAAACMTPLSLVNQSFDPQCGAGDLLKAAAHQRISAAHPSQKDRIADQQHLYGCDIDSRVSIPDGYQSSRWTLYKKTDFTKLFPLLMDVGFTHPQILSNPPFSLRWPTTDLRAALIDHNLEDLVPVLDDHTGKDATCDSTLWTILANLVMLHANGESMVICNDSTATRFAYDNHGNGNRLLDYIWLWVKVDAPVFQNQQTPFATAVLYLSKSHVKYARGVTRRTINTADHDAIVNELTPIKNEKWRYHNGLTIDSYNAPKTTPLFDAAHTEYASRAAAKQQPYNISLDAEGRIRINLSTYARAKFSRTEAQQLNSLIGLRDAFPAQLVVQVPTRRAMVAAAHGNIWTVDPAAIVAIDAACANYNAVRAPFFRPSAVQCLAYLDEEDSLTCIANGLPGISKGDLLRINTYTEKIETPSHKFNLAGEREDCTLRSMELVVCVTDNNGETHTFHVDKPGEEVDSKYQHSVHELLHHFHIPIPQDIAELHPDKHQKNLALLDLIEARINS